MGGIASSRVPAPVSRRRPDRQLAEPTSLLIGVLSVATAAYLAAVYLAADATRAGRAGLAEAFRSAPSAPASSSAGWRRPACPWCAAVARDLVGTGWTQRRQARRRDRPGPWRGVIDVLVARERCAHARLSGCPAAVAAISIGWPPSAQSPNPCPA